MTKENVHPCTRSLGDLFLVVLNVLTINQLSDPPVHVELSPVHVKSSWHHPHTPSVITQSLHLMDMVNYNISIIINFFYTCGN